MKSLQQHIIALALVTLSATMAHATQLTVDGRLAVLDSLTNTYLCPLPKAQFGQSLDAVVAFDCNSMSIDGTAVTGGTRYNFGIVEGSKRWTLNIAEGDTTATRYITFTYLPVMVMNGTFGYEYVLGTIQVLDPDRYSDEAMPCRVKWRGGTTNADGKNKRNYHLKFVDEAGNKMDRKLLGLRNDNSWIMDAGQADFLRVRNRVATQLWNDFAHKPYYANYEPKVKTGVDGGMIEVILNGKYVGFYALTENMDRKTLRLTKYNETTGEIYGQLWKTSELNTTVTFNKGVEFDNTQETFMGIETKYPELDEVFPSDYKVLSDAIWLADTATEAQFNKLSHEYFDMPVMIDYEIFMQALLALDNYGKNMYWAVYDRSLSNMLTLGVWDLDATMGGFWSPAGYHPVDVTPTRNIIFSHGVFKRISRPFSIYWKQGIDRYQQLRQGVLSTDSLIARYELAVKEIKDCGAIAREQARWSHDSDLAGRQLKIDEVELPYLKNWIKARMDYLDNTRFATPMVGDVNGDRVVDILDMNIIINTTLDSEGWYSYPNADVNGDMTIDVSDINDEINWLLLNP